MDYQLVVQHGRSAAKTIRLADGVTTVGRQDGCELTVRSSQVSRKHCQLFEKKGLLLVKDLGSANGTFVNGKRIEEQRVLEAGDELLVGPIKFRVEKATAAAAPAAAAGVSSGSDPGAKAGPGDTAIPESVDPPIPLDEDDVLSFVTGDDDTAPPPAKVAPAAKPAKAPAAKPAKAPEPEPAQASSPPAKAAAPPAKPKAKPSPEPEPAPESGEADEAIAEFLMGIEVDDDDRR
ncbi:FHA domain-containing protein [Tautonia plasticadhaerens]|uniref:Glycogen accumulation regulator GarA n=1 Tax=Tautonia plasticadhaerens TaxID=2527974 RepID=A0A518HAZ4_9BACT|nr:FHA domain-containing protein [Tautonia plasticadhaerens]QDV38009.1 Glycogen accumulation regulator GarA [Tautonia plasticadhaerens]